MRFGRIGLTRPEQFPKPFIIYRYTSSTSERGRLHLSNLTQIGVEKCILSVAKPDEMERFDQMGVKVTHDILQRGAPVAKENDVFILVKGGVETRKFRVQAVHPKGEMDIDTLYYCEERSDL